MWRQRIKEADLGPARYINLVLASWVLISAYAWPHWGPQFMVTIFAGALVAIVAPFQVGSKWVRRALMFAGLYLAVGAVALPHATDLTTLKLPDLPSWVTGLPLVGERIDSAWQSARTDLGMEKLRPYIMTATQWLVAKGAQLGLTLLEFVLALVFTGILYVTGESFIALVKKFALRIGGESSFNLLSVAVQTIRSVAFGVIGTALIQALLSVGSFLIAGVPGVAVL